ncbi:MULTISPECIES: HPF/RaiA family ribosome-associated protein [unclassified Acidovorax]|uniref:HPF/RaiA family ribosome-associated protein n=1 Tax=unclassified Acidovorax TaxID=2684926 RepID=UPI0028834B37|nr:MULTISPECIES: HPF/RaiA family ribosome-associated protein [unclassified Acidovorax]
MQVQVQTDDHIDGSEAMNRWIQDETNTRLLRFRDHLTRVEIHLSDLDAGKSGGADKRCSIEARAAGRPPLAVTADAEKVPEAFTAAIDKLARALDNDLGRLKDKAGRETIRTADGSVV